MAKSKAKSSNSLVDPVILVPGITATNLEDTYPIPPETVWRQGAISKKKFERITLHPNDLRYEALEPARIIPYSIPGIAYNEIIEELRHNLTEKEDAPVPVYPFCYDWRMPLKDIEEQLDQFVHEIVDRTKLMRHYHQANYSGKVNLIGHSMGGLVIAGYLEGMGKKAPVNKVVTLATPFRGSLEATVMLCTGTANMGVSPPSSRERESGRLTPALYHLLPSFTEGIQISAGLPQTLFDPGVWQPSVTDSLAEFIRLKGLPTNNIPGAASKLFKDLLTQARNHRDRVDQFKLTNAGLTEKDWLCVAGADAVTRVKLNIIKRGGKPDFDLQSGDRANDWASTNLNSGDGTVPLRGAIPNFIKKENIVCITPDDYGYWEMGDKALTKAGGFHGILPNMNMLHRLIVRFFKGLPDPRNNTWGRRLPGVTNWDPPIANLHEMV